MVRKFLLGAAALVVSCSLAFAGESKVKVEAGIDIGVVESLEIEIDGYDVLESDSISIVPRVSVTGQFTENWSAAFEFRAVVGFEDDDADLGGGEDGEVTPSEIKVGGYAGYTFALSDKLALTPTLGLSWRSYESDIEVDGEEADFDGSLLTLDFGARVAVSVTDKIGVRGFLLFGIPVSGSNELNDVGETLDADLDGGFLVSLAGEVTYNVTGNIALVGGLGYEKDMIDWEWEDVVDGEDEIARFTIRVGAVFSF